MNFQVVYALNAVRRSRITVQEMGNRLEVSFPIRENWPFHPSENLEWFFDIRGIGLGRYNALVDWWHALPRARRWALREPECVTWDELLKEMK